MSSTITELKNRFIDADTHSKNLAETAQFIADTQLANGAIPWFKGGKLDPWDHTEAAMGLSVAGRHKEAEAAYEWLLSQQLDDGSWHANYYTKELPPLRETNFIAYIATGIWHHYLVTGNKDFLKKMFPCVKAAIHFVLRQQSPHGEIAWAVNADNKPQNDALVTACSSIIRSLECAVFCAETLGLDATKWRSSGQQLREALLFKPFRFDRTWESKTRFAMDWYYPILAGIFTPEEARLRLQNRWDEFIKPELGCRCVNDEPWVTMAETSELVMALIAAGQNTQATALYATLNQWRTPNGGYWTGYVYKDNTLWPDEVTTWTAGAVLLAADALQTRTKASTLFIKPCIF